MKLKVYVVAIKSKGGVCWHYDSGVVLDGKRLQVVNQEGRRKCCSASASPQVFHTEPASRDAGQPFRRCVRPVHTFQGREKLVGASCVVSSRRLRVSLVSARGIVPRFGEKLAYIKQRSSFGLSIILIYHLLV